MANEHVNNDHDALLKSAWRLLWPSCVASIDEQPQDAFDIGPTQSCTPDKFYDVLQLWWRQPLKLASLDQLPQNHLDVLRQYLSGDGNRDDANDGDLLSKIVGFHQPKNGTCGLVAALHCIYLSCMWDKYIADYLQQQALSSTDILMSKPQLDSAALLRTSIAQALLTSAKSASAPLEYDALQIGRQKQTTTANCNTKKSWQCVHCKAQNAAENVFCGECFKEPAQQAQPPPTNTSDKMEIDAPEETDMRAIAECRHIFIVTDGQLPAQTEDNDALFYNESLFGFNVHCIPYHNKQQQQESEYDTLQRIEQFLGDNLDFSGNFIEAGCCVRILLSLILTHGAQRCEFELVTNEYEQIVRQFRDESLVLGPYGFCSQNLVNLALFGDCKPIISAPPSLSYPYGFLGHDVINPGATGFYQMGYGYEYPHFPVWVVLSGTHYTTLFATPTHVQKHDGQHVLDSYHAMVKWMTADDNKQKQPQNSNSQASSNATDTAQSTNPAPQSSNSETQPLLALPPPVSLTETQPLLTSNSETQPWQCPCGFSNAADHVICGDCFLDKSLVTESMNAATAAPATQSAVHTKWKCAFCAFANDATHVFCGGCFTEKPNDDGPTSAAPATASSEGQQHEHKQEEKEEEKVHFEVDLLCFNGLPPSGPLLAPVSIQIITEQQGDAEKRERDRVIKATDVLSMIDNDEADASKKLKYIKGHALVQRLESQLRKNVYFYEIAISLEPHFEEIQNWKSPYFMKFKNEEEWKTVKEYFDPKILPNLSRKNSGYEYPSIKWRCCSCYLGDDMNKKYAGYNELESALCKACGKPMYEALRTLIVAYEHVPFYLRESKIDKVYQNPLVKLLQKRFRNLVQGKVDNDCLPVI